MHELSDKRAVLMCTDHLCAMVFKLKNTPQTSILRILY